MEIVEFPKQLYKQGWVDLTDTVVVLSSSEEDSARADGYKMLAEFGDQQVADAPSESNAKDLIAAIKSGSMTKEELESLAESERAGKNRKGVLAAIADALE